MLIIGLVCFSVLFFLGRYVYSGAAQLLSDEEKVRLVDLSLQQRK